MYQVRALKDNVKIYDGLVITSIQNGPIISINTIRLSNIQLYQLKYLHHYLNITLK